VIWYADLHVHSRFAYATSRALTVPSLVEGARLKGLVLLGTGDITHPTWRRECESLLSPDDLGLYRPLEATGAAGGGHAQPELWSPPERPGRDAAPRFVPSAEVATVSRRGAKIHRVHHLLFFPSFAAAGRASAALARYGDLEADGRPTLALSPRELVDAVLSAEPDAEIVPAHVWTPWFSLFGSRSGFDAVEACYESAAGAIHALETGLSADPVMCRRVSALDRYTLVSGGDAHGPATLGREATGFEGERSWRGLVGALRGEAPAPARVACTLELFPQEGKYHWDGHRLCGVRMPPAESRRRGGRCPECGRPLTIGVLHRVEALADRVRPPGAGARPGEACHYVVPLRDLAAAALGRTQAARSVRVAVERLVAAAGSEIAALVELPESDLRRAGPPEVAEAILAVRAGRVEIDPGYDGVYGTVRLAPPRARKTRA
jgi:uncharacterized protein (TIGR00375 family)